MAKSVAPAWGCGPGLRRSASEACDHPNLETVESEREILDGELQQERRNHQRTSERVRDAEHGLREAKRLAQRCGHSPAAPPVTTKAAPQDQAALPKMMPDKRKQGVVSLPCIRQHSPNPPKVEAARVAIEEDEFLAAGTRAICLDKSRMAALSREERSRWRMQAIAHLGNAGMDSWELRREEKATRLRNLGAYGEGMWGSFKEWQDETKQRHVE